MDEGQVEWMVVKLAFELVDEMVVEMANWQVVARVVSRGSMLGY